VEGAMAESEPKPARKLIYLRPVELEEVCLLQEALYWVAFGRLPTSDNRYDYLFDTYKPKNGELTNEESERAALPPDPRLNYDWAEDVVLSDQIEEIVASRELVEDETEQNDSTRKQVRSEAAKLLAEMTEWKPKFERAIELAASEVYAALRKGHLTSKGKRLPDPDVAVALKLLADQNKQISELDVTAIPKDFWSLPNTYWEISAARNGAEHYCHIYCPTDELMSLFGVDITTGEPVDGLVQHGSFFVLSPNSAPMASPARRSKARGHRAGRPRQYQWDQLHVEMAALVRDGLPAKIDAAVEHLREAYRKTYGEPVPAPRTLYDWVEPYYHRFCGKQIH
jgi:hypothetical protein